jgi:hypothetical protein
MTNSLLLETTPTSAETPNAPTYRHKETAAQFQQTLYREIKWFLK